MYKKHPGISEIHLLIAIIKCIYNPSNILPIITKYKILRKEIFSRLKHICLSVCVMSIVNIFLVALYQWNFLHAG